MISDIIYVYVDWDVARVCCMFWFVIRMNGLLYIYIYEVRYIYTMCWGWLRKKRKSQEMRSKR